MMSTPGERSPIIPHTQGSLAERQRHQDIGSHCGVGEEHCRSEHRSISWHRREVFFRLSDAKRILSFILGLATNSW